MLTSLSLHIRLLLLLLPPGRLFAPRKLSNSSRIMRSASSRVTCTSLKYPRPASLVREMYMRVNFLDVDDLKGEGEGSEAAAAAAAGGEEGISMNGKCAVVCTFCLSVLFLLLLSCVMEEEEEEGIRFEVADVRDAGCNKRFLVVFEEALGRPRLCRSSMPESSSSSESESAAAASGCSKFGPKALANAGTTASFLPIASESLPKFLMEGCTCF